MSLQYNLYDLGWNENLEKEYEPFKQNYDVGRVAVVYQDIYKILCPQGERLAVLPGKILHLTMENHELPAVGDWALVDKIDSSEDRSVIRGILSRKSIISRKRAGKTSEEQVIAVNVDMIFICMSLNQDFNLRRLERYITLALNSGTEPVILLTKSDLCDEISEKTEPIKKVAKKVSVLCVSCLNKSGLENIREYIQPGNTIAFLGSSGVGKSTIINELLGESRQLTKKNSTAGGKGRHATTNRELILLPNKGVVIDTPGMRELHLLDVDRSIDTTFDDVEQLASMCKFRNCTHTVEPQCAVREAIEKGNLDEDRYLSYVKLKKEAQAIERRRCRKSDFNSRKSKS